MPGKLKTQLCIALSAAVLFAAPCAEPGRWRKSSAGQGDWNRDKAACQSLARKEAEKRYRQLASEVRAPLYGAGHTLKRDMALYDAKRTQKRLFESCLKSRGYSPAEEAPKKD